MAGGRGRARAHRRTALCRQRSSLPGVEAPAAAALASSTPPTASRRSTESCGSSGRERRDERGEAAVRDRDRRGHGADARGPRPAAGRARHSRSSARPRTPRRCCGWWSATRPDAALVDIKMPPTHTDEGLRAAGEIRERYPAHGRAPALELPRRALRRRRSSRAIRPAPATCSRSGSATPGVLSDALRRLRHGECVLDPAIVNRLLNRAREPGPLDELSPREREILSLMAEGTRTSRICELCFLEPEDGREPHPQHLHEARARRIAPTAAGACSPCSTYLRA